MRLDLVFPRFKLLSGAERTILALAAALVEAGHRPRIVCHRFDPSCRPRVAPGVEVVVTGRRLDWFRNRYLNAAFDYLRVLQLRRELDPGADAAVFFGPALLLAWYLRAVLSVDLPSVYFCWEPPRVLYQDREKILQRLGWLRLPVAGALRAYRAFDRRMVRRVDAVATNSPFTAERIAKCYGRGATVITHGIDRERLDAALDAGPRREEPEAGRTERIDSGRRGPERGRPPRILTVNFLHPRKRIDLALETMARLRERGDDLDGVPRLRVVGDGPERDELMARAEALEIDDLVEFPGFVAEEELPREYAESDCYLHTAREESFGLSVIEAAYCGLPVVAVDEGGVKETVVDGVTGFRVPADPDALADAAHRLLERPDGGRSMGRAGRDHVASRYDWSRGAEELASLIDELDGPGRGGRMAGREP